MKWRWCFFFFYVLQFPLCVHTGTMVSKLSSIYHFWFNCRLVIDFDKMELPYMFSLESWFKHADVNTRCPVKKSTWCGCLMMFDQLASSLVYIIRWLDLYLYYESLGNPVRVLQKNVYIYIYTPYIKYILYIICHTFNIFYIIHSIYNLHIIHIIYGIYYM